MLDAAVGMTRDELNALHCSAPTVADEAKHFYACEHCGQAVDARRLGDVVHHVRPHHDPLP